MNEMGILYHGAYEDIAERQWNYGQVVKNQMITLSVITCYTKVAVVFSSTMEFWMPVCTSWTDLKCLSPIEEIQSRWSERPRLW